MEKTKISKAKFNDAYGNGVTVDFENGDNLILYGDTDLTSFYVQAFCFNGKNYSICDNEKINKLLDYVASVINDDSNETFALFRGMVKIYLDFSIIKGKNKNI